MPRFTLRLAAREEVSAEEAASSFYWLTDQRSSFTPGMGPSLGLLGAVPALNIDVVRIALAAFAADRSVPREARGSNWNQRPLELEIPVSDPAAWDGVADELASVLGFLSGDRWALSFVKEQAPVEAVRLPDVTTAPKRVVLLSGGADSAIGGLYSRSLLADGEHHVLLSHFSNTMLAPIQRHVAAEIERLIPGPTQQHVVVHLGRREKRIDGTAYASEPTSRSRSLLFLALGLAVASIHKVPLWIPENGFASINPPLGPERLGSLSTRTTHPRFLQDLSAVLTKAGTHAVIENPFARSTKGEMYQRVVDLVGPDEASTFLSATHSCALTGQRAHHISAEVPCGICFGCVLRRASFTVSGVRDATQYIAPSSDPVVQKWLDSKSVEQPVRNFIRRGVRGRDLAALGLPQNYSLRDALALCQRGIKELRSLYP
jgi:7-cyano-7-deazaguanine synthase in queuosine biosynthesis